MGKRTPLYQRHCDANARMVDFAGWDMPLHYGSQVKEHHQVRQHAGMFDVSHMTVVDITGLESKEFLRKILANDVARLNHLGKALYTAMLSVQGTVLDDLIVFSLRDGFRAVVNCATRKKDLDWINSHAAGFEVNITERHDLAIIAVQGPESIGLVRQAVQPKERAVIESLKVFQGLEVSAWFIARTGYTGERGLEIILPNEDAGSLWDALAARGVSRIGLGARDTLRLEAGMNLYGNEMDETVSPLEANMAGTISFAAAKREFIGRRALEEEIAGGIRRSLVGVVLETRGVLRKHQRLLADGRLVGELTSGAYSPTLGHSIGLARVQQDSLVSCEVEIRDKRHFVRIVNPPFVRNGEKVFDQ